MLYTAYQIIGIVRDVYLDRDMELHVLFTTLHNWFFNVAIFEVLKYQNVLIRPKSVVY